MNITFNKISLLVIAILLILVAGFGLLVEFSPPKISSKVALNGTQYSASFVDQKVVLKFNTPMNTQSVADNISVTPEAEYDLFWSQSSLNILFKKPLNASTNYSIKVSKLALDIYNDEIAKDFSFEFKTKPRNLAYLKRNEDESDSVVLANDKLEEQSNLFTSNNIEFFDMDSDYLVAGINPDKDYSSLIIKDLNKGSETKLDIGTSRLTFIDYSPVEDKFVYITQNVQIQAGNVIPDSASRIFIYDIKSKKTEEVSIPETAIDVLQAYFSPDGKALVIKGAESGYFFQSIVDDSVLDLGKHLDIKGFNSSKDKILFIDAPFQSVSASFPMISTVDGQGTISNITDGSNYSIDPVFFHTKESLIFSNKISDSIGTKGLFGISTFDVETKEISEIYFKENTSSELPVLSYDDKFVVIEQYSLDDLSQFEGLRNFSFQSKPYNANLILINLETEEIIDTGIRGVNAVWVR